MQVRKAERRDLEGLGRLGAMLVQVHYDFDRLRFLAPNEGTSRGYAAFLGHELESPEACIFVADEKDAIQGYVYGALEPPSWKELRGPAGFIHDILVVEGARRSGIAVQLMQAAIDWLRQRRAPRVILGTAAANVAAQTLFRRLGFRDTMIEMTLELK